MYFKMKYRIFHRLSDTSIVVHTTRGMSMSMTRRTNTRTTMTVKYYLRVGWKCLWYHQHGMVVWHTNTRTSIIIIIVILLLHCCRSVHA